MEDNNARKIPYEFAEEFADTWADLNALYRAADKLEARMWGMVKWARHSLDDQSYEVVRLRYAPYGKGGRKSLEEIGNTLGFTKEWTRQLEKKSLKTLGVKLYRVSVTYARDHNSGDQGVRVTFNNGKNRLQVS